MLIICEKAYFQLEDRSYERNDLLSAVSSCTELKRGSDCSEIYKGTAWARWKLYDLCRIPTVSTALLSQCFTNKTT